LKIVMNKIEDDGAKGHVQEFLASHPQLQSLELCVTSQMPVDLLDTIGKSCRALRRLRIVTKGFSKCNSKLWQFLSGLKDLQEFEFSLHRSDRFDDNIGDFKKMFKALPPNLIRLVIKGLGEYSGEEFLVEGLQAMNVDPMIVTHLDVGSSGMLVDDETLQFIIQYFKRLRYLDISNSICTDEAFTGKGMGANGQSDSGIEIKQLRGLRTLKLSHCKDVTDVICEEAIEFLDLVVLDLTQIRTITKGGIAALLNKNPSLEELYVDVPVSFDDVAKDHPRLRILSRSTVTSVHAMYFPAKNRKEELSESEPEGSDDED